MMLGSVGVGGSWFCEGGLVPVRMLINMQAIPNFVEASMHCWGPFPPFSHPSIHPRSLSPFLPFRKNVNSAVQVLLYFRLPILNGRSRGRQEAGGERGRTGRSRYSVRRQQVDVGQWYRANLGQGRKECSTCVRVEYYGER